ncbi:MAG: methyltransferase, partial [candidate division WOR-3 bacterium]
IILLIGVIIRIKVDLLMFQKPQSIIRRGLYNRIRHPAYFATLLIIFSIACAFSSLLALGYVLAVGLPLIYLEARFEDLFLARINGSDYEAYKKETRLFIPNIL